MNSMRRLFYLLTVLAMLTVAFAGIGCDAGAGNSTTDNGNDSGQIEAGSNNSDGAFDGGTIVPMPADSGTSGETDDTEAE
jgi:hypothetical protein